MKTFWNFTKCLDSWTSCFKMWGLYFLQSLEILRKYVIISRTHTILALFFILTYSYFDQIPHFKLSFRIQSRPRGVRPQPLPQLRTEGPERVGAGGRFKTFSPPSSLLLDGCNFRRSTDRSQSEKSKIHDIFRRAAYPNCLTLVKNIT